MNVIEIIYMGRTFYSASGTKLSSLCYPNFSRSDWGQVQLHLNQGDEVTIRQPSLPELTQYKAMLADIRMNERKA